MAPTPKPLRHVRSVLAEESAAFFGLAARHLLDRPSAAVDGRVADGGVDLGLRVNAAAAPGGANRSRRWRQEVHEFLESRFEPPSSVTSTCAGWFADPGQRGLFVLLGDGGAGKSWSTARAVALRSRGLAEDFSAGRVSVDDPAWLAPLWVDASALAAFLPRLAEYLRREGRPAVDATGQFAWFLAWSLTGVKEICDPFASRAASRWRTLLERRLRAGRFVLVLDAVNELAGDRENRGRNAFHDLVKALADAVTGETAGPSSGRLVFCCRQAAWEDIFRLDQPPLPTVCREAVRCVLLPMGPSQIDDLARRHHARGTGQEPPATERGFRERLAPHDDPLGEGWSPLILALILGAGIAPDEARRLHIAAILDRAADAFLRGVWRKERPPLVDAPGLGLVPTPNFGGRVAAAKEVVGLMAWCLSRRRPGANAFNGDEWLAAFEESRERLRRDGRRSLLDPGEAADGRTRQANAWLTACHELGLLAGDGTESRFIHPLIFSYFAAYGLAARQPKGVLSSDPWIEAFEQVGIEHGRVHPGTSSLFSLLPGAAAARGPRDPLRPEEASRRLGRRLTRLCRAVRQSVAVDSSGLTTVLRLAIVTGCEAVADTKKKQTLRDAMRRFPLDGGLSARLLKDGSLIDAAPDDAPEDAERQVREQLRPVPWQPRLQALWASTIRKGAAKRRYFTGLGRLSHSMAKFFPAANWLFAIGAIKPAREMTVQAIRQWSPRMNLPLRIAVLQTLYAQSRTPASVLSPEAFLAVARNTYEDAVAVLSLPHAVHALPSCRKDLVCLRDIADGAPPPLAGGGGTARLIWQEDELRELWSGGEPSPGPGSLPRVRRRLLDRARRLLRSIAEERCDFWLWFQTAYLYSARAGHDRFVLGSIARYLIRRWLPERYFYPMALAMVGRLAWRNASAKLSSPTGMGAVVQDFSHLPPRPSWRYVSRVVPFILFSFQMFWLLLTLALVLLIFSHPAPRRGLVP